MLQIKNRISVCERWKVFENFLEDMGPMPFPEASIERRDNNKGYSPDNCYWATWSQQAQNRRNALRLSLNGKTMTATEWAKELGMKYQTLFDRKRKGWTDERALTEPKLTYRQVTFNGETMSLTEWCFKLKLPYPSVVWRLKHAGWSVERAFNTPIQEKYHHKKRI